MDADPMPAMFPVATRWQAATSWMLIAANGVLIGFFLCWLGLHHQTVATNWVWLVPAFLIGLFMADLCSGFVHWASDTWFDGSWAARTVAIAREHHLRPQNILGYGFREYCSYSSAPSLLVTVPASLAFTILTPPSPASHAGILACLVIALAMFFGSHCHALGHRAPRNRLIALLQRAGLLMGPRHHGQHHRGRHDIRFCVINGWANHVCDRIGWWRAMEWLVGATTGAVPRRNDREWAIRFREDPRFWERDPKLAAHLAAECHRA